MAARLVAVLALAVVAVGAGVADNEDASALVAVDGVGTRAVHRDGGLRGGHEAAVAGRASAAAAARELGRVVVKGGRGGADGAGVHGGRRDQGFEFVEM